MKEDDRPLRQCRGLSFLKMGKIQLSPEEKLRNKVMQNISSRQNYLNRTGYREAKDQFVEQFILCEIGIKTILSFYYKNRGEEKAIENLEMPITTIKAALKDAKITIDDDTINKMFKAKQKRGARSARDLRNGIVHDLNVRDIQEVIDRKKELLSIMEIFIKKIMSTE